MRLSGLSANIQCVSYQTGCFVANNQYELTMILGSLVLDAFIANSSSLVFTLPDTFDVLEHRHEAVDFVVEGNVIRFSSISTRNRMIAEYVYMKNLTDFSNDNTQWFLTAYDLWHHEIGEKDTVTGMLLAKVHQTNDVFMIGVTVIKNKLLRVFDVLHLIECALPCIENIAINSLMQLIEAQHDVTKNDFAGGMFFNKLEDKLANMPDYCLAIHRHLLTNATEPTIALYPVILIAYAKSMKSESLRLVLNDAKSAFKLIKNAAIWTLGRFVFLNIYQGEDVNIVYEEILANTASSDDDVRFSAQRAAASVAHTTDFFDDALTKFAKSNDQYVLGLLVDTLYFHTDEISQKQCFGYWLQLMSGLTSEKVGILNQLDFALSRLVGREEYQGQIIEFWTQWSKLNTTHLARDKTVADIFNDTLHAIANKPSLLSRVITGWLLDDDQKLASATSGLLSSLWVSGQRNQEFDTAQLEDLSRDDFMFLARKMLGFVHSESQLLSLTFSLLNTKNAKERVYGIVNSLLITQIGADYPLATIEAIETQKQLTQDEELKAFLDQVSTEIHKRIDALNALPMLKELRPPIHLEREFTKTRDKQMQSSMEEAQKGSIFRQLCAEVPIKAGVAFFSYRDGAYSEPAHMAEFSNSVQLPRRHVCDTVGQEIEQFHFRTAKREDK